MRQLEAFEGDLGRTPPHPAVLYRQKVFSEAFREGRSVAEIAGKYRYSVSTVYRVLDKSGARPRKKKILLDGHEGNRAG